jgi:hypothetical protein
MGGRKVEDLAVLVTGWKSCILYLEFIAVSGNVDESSQCKRLLKTLKDCLILSFHFLLRFLTIFKKLSYFPKRGPNIEAYKSKF